MIESVGYLSRVEFGSNDNFNFVLKETNPYIMYYQPAFHYKFDIIPLPSGMRRRFNLKTPGIIVFH